ncbi:lipopolysaccharide biosynthesis protein [Spirosoma montaniterrae]|uniref:Uncharacterized protein n=1 Tax=Spirosoma montaniterrae TaxID=1178516 RepID=A0A1P9X227_9BACT|nr:polysaccharide biosynthesis C-terminal domain-containing protein [Spirosoma montaniterrae]AQG81684.1 hypothetical protein AWR27_21680 [Spirosoma montaniterrae]
MNLAPSAIRAELQRLRQHSWQSFSGRTRTTWLNSLLGVVARLGGIVSTLYAVPLTIDYLTPAVYGLWLTIGSITALQLITDLGIANGLRNRLAEAWAANNWPEARAYLSTAYVYYGLVQFALIIVFLVVYRYIPWQHLLTAQYDNATLQRVLLVVVVTTSVRSVADLLSCSLLAVQKSGLAALLQLLISISTLTGIWLVAKFVQQDRLWAVALVSGLLPVLLLSIASLILYRTTLRKLRPTWRLIDSRQARSLLPLSSSFLVIQLTVLVIYHTDNLLIAYLYGPAAVTPYAIALRCFGALILLFSVVLTPYWSAFTEAYVKKDTVWMQSAYRHMQRLWLVYAFGVLLVFGLSDQLYAYWINDRVHVPWQLSACMALFAAINGWNTITASISNGLSKVRLQVYYSVIAAAINIPLSLFLARNLSLGSTGIILATVGSLFICTVCSTKQVYKLLSGTATGIWNR